MEECMNSGKYSDSILYINQILNKLPRWKKIQFLQVESLAYLGLTDKVKPFIKAK